MRLLFFERRILLVGSWKVYLARHAVVTAPYNRPACCLIRDWLTWLLIEPVPVLKSPWRLLSILLLACMASGGGAVFADIRDTKHNLSGKRLDSTGLSKEEERRQLSREVCVFCHTPSADLLAGSSVSGGESAPRIAKWQRSVEATFSFELFDDIGRTGADIAGEAPIGSVSVACLSCHDSAQALGVTPGGASDHPFGVPYRGVNRPAGESASQFRNRLLSEVRDVPARLGVYIGDDSEFRPVRSGVVNKRTIWWASVGDTGQRAKTDLPLYPRRLDGGGGYSQVPFVECTSCHDPHSSREVFLRTSNERDTLCLTCHIK